MQVIEKLVTGIRGCAVASGAVAMLEILTTLGKASPCSKSYQIVWLCKSWAAMDASCVPSSLTRCW